MNLFSRPMEDAEFELPSYNSGVSRPPIYDQGQPPSKPTTPPIAPSRFPVNPFLKPEKYPDITPHVENFKFQMFRNLANTNQIEGQGKALNQLANNFAPQGNYDTTSAKFPEFPGYTNGQPEWARYKNNLISGNSLNHHLYGLGLGAIAVNPFKQPGVIPNYFQNPSAVYKGYQSFVENASPGNALAEPSKKEASGQFQNGTMDEDPILAQRKPTSQPVLEGRVVITKDPSNQPPPTEPSPPPTVPSSEPTSPGAEQPEPPVFSEVSLPPEKAPNRNSPNQQDPVYSPPVPKTQTQAPNQIPIYRNNQPMLPLNVLLDTAIQSGMSTYHPPVGGNVYDRTEHAMNHFWEHIQTLPQFQKLDPQTQMDVKEGFILKNVFGLDGQPVPTQTGEPLDLTAGLLAGLAHSGGFLTQPFEQMLHTGATRYDVTQEPAYKVNPYFQAGANIGKTAADLSQYIIAGQLGGLPGITGVSANQNLQRAANHEQNLGQAVFNTGLDTAIGKFAPGGQTIPGAMTRGAVLGGLGGAIGNAGNQALGQGQVDLRQVSQAAAGGMLQGAVLGGAAKVVGDRQSSLKLPPNNGAIGKMEEIILPKGTIIDRYGYEGGKFVSPVGTPFEMRSLPAEKINGPYHIYEVLKPIGVQAGEIAPWFDQPGGGIQYIFKDTIKELIDNGIIREVK